METNKWSYNETYKQFCTPDQYGGVNRWSNGDVLIALNNLESRLTALSEAMRWIPVGERLPDGDECVITYSVNNRMVRHVTVSLYTEDYGWFPDCEDLNQITHWMPLPPAPTDSKQNNPGQPG